MSKTFSDDLLKTIDEFKTVTRNELRQRFQSWSICVENQNLHEVIGALLARQVTLVNQLVSSPSIWTPHSAPLFHRSIADVYISLAWICKDPASRAVKFIEHGLGDAVLEAEHRKQQLRVNGIEEDPMIEFLQNWVDSQMARTLVEVNVGNWSGKTTRKMAEEAECLDFYNYVYSPFSACVHSSWKHVSRLNCIVDPNPLHSYFLLPYDPDLEPSVHEPLLATKYLKKSFDLFTETFLTNDINVLSSDEWLRNRFSELGKKWSQKDLT